MALLILAVGRGMGSSGSAKAQVTGFCEQSNKLEVILTVHRPYYVEIKYQLDATDDIYCRFYCMLNMFRAILCPSSGAREYLQAAAKAAACKPDT